MPIAAQRFNFLDKDTNLATLDFTKLANNAVYNATDQLTETALGANKDSENILNVVQGKISGLNAIMKKSPEIMDTVMKEAVDSAMETMSNMELPEVVNDIFASLKKLDTPGLRSFFKELLHIGSTILCNNLDLLKLFMLGYAINKNILSGLLIALLLNWLDRYCKEFTKQEMAKASKRDKVDLMFPPKGVKVTNDNAFDLFTCYYSEYLKSKIPFNLPTPLTPNQFVINVINGDIDGSISNLKNAEISNSEKDIYLNSINSALNNYPAGTTQHNNLLTAKGKLINTAFVNSTRRSNNIAYEHLYDKLGSFSKNLVSTDIKPSNIFNTTDIEKSLYNKLFQLKSNASNNNDLLVRNNNTGSYNNFNFDSILPELTQDEINYINNKCKGTDSHRLYDLHPTTTVFLN